MQDAQQFHPLLKIDVGDRIAVHRRDDRLRVRWPRRQNDATRGDDQIRGIAARRELHKGALPARRIQRILEAFLLAEFILRRDGFLVDPGKPRHRLRDAIERSAILGRLPEAGIAERAQLDLHQQGLVMHETTIPIILIDQL